MPVALITGVTGQDGSYLAEWLLNRGYRVVGLDLAPWPDGPEFQRLRQEVELVRESLTDEDSLRRMLERYRPGEIYNFAARASSAHLFADPVLTSEINGLAVLKMLDAIRTVDPTIRFCQASSSEMFGEALESPQNEGTPLRPRNPYGIAKLFAHGMIGTYRDTSGLFACSAILFNHESPRRAPELVTRKISLGVARIKNGLADSLTLGSLDATRDWGFAGDTVRAMWLMLQAEQPDDYVAATGESHSVREFCELAFSRADLDYRRYVRLDASAQRPPERVQRVGDASRLRMKLGWRPTVSFRELVHMMVDADLERLK